MIAGEELDGTYVLYTHADDVTTALHKLGYSPDDQFTHDGITLWKYTLPNKEVLKNPVVAKAVIESAMDLKHIIRRLEFPLYSVGDDTGIFQCSDPKGDVYLGLARDPNLLNELLQKSQESGISIRVVTVIDWQDLYNILESFKASDIKYVTRFLDTKMVERYNLETVLMAVSLMLSKPAANPQSN